MQMCMEDKIAWLAEPVPKNRNVRASLSPGGINWHIVVSCRVTKGATMPSNSSKHCSIHLYEEHRGPAALSKDAHMLHALHDLA